MFQHASINQNEQVLDCLELLTHQQVLVDQLQGMSRNQETPPPNQTNETILTILSQRQSLIDQIIRIQNDLGKKMGELKDVVKHLDAHEQKQLDALLNSIEGGLSDVMKRDDELNSLLALSDIVESAATHERTGQAVYDNH